MDRATFEKQITTLSDELADDLLVVETARAMNAKLERKRREGRCGWWHEDCSAFTLLEMAMDHAEKLHGSDWTQVVDVINLFAMAKMRYEMDLPAPPESRE